MSWLVVSGGEPLRGRVAVSGAKNAILAVLPATLLAQGETTLDNAPVIRDVYFMGQLLQALGARVECNGKGFRVDPAGATWRNPPLDLERNLRASSLLLGPLLARFGRAELGMPGGCNIGPRPLDQHLKGLQALGADIRLEHGYIVAQASRLVGTRIYLDITSVGATENIMMAASLARGRTIIENAAKEPEIVDLANLINSMGGRITGAGTDIIKVDGVRELQGVHHTVIPDRIEAGTYLIAAAATGGEVVVENLIPEHLEPLIAKLREAGATVTVRDDTVFVGGFPDRPQPLDIKTLPYPGFPTDLQSPMTSLLSVCQGTSLIKENLYENRFRHTEELRGMGAQIKVEGRVAVIEGVPALGGARVQATDLRAGAALLVAGLMARGETTVTGAQHIHRGYEDILGKLRGLGATIWEEETGDQEPLPLLGDRPGGR